MTAKAKSTGGLSAGDQVIDIVMQNYLEVVEVDGDEVVVRHTQEAESQVPFRLPVSRVKAHG